MALRTSKASDSGTAMDSALIGGTKLPAPDSPSKGLGSIRTRVPA